MPLCRRLLGSCWLAALAGCTPVGLWVYDDPGLEVSRVRLQPEEMNAPPVMLGLAVLNPNDYDLATARLNLRLRLDHTPIAHFQRDSIFSVPRYGIADLILPLTPMPHITRERLRTIATGTRHFEVEGVATFSTPFGPHDVRFVHAGEMVFARPGRTDAAQAAEPEGERRVTPRQVVPSVRQIPDRGMDARNDR